MAPGVQLGVDLLLERDGIHVCRPLPGKLVKFHVVESELVFIFEYYVFLILFHNSYMFKVLADILHFLPK